MKKKKKKQKHYTIKFKTTHTIKLALFIAKKW